MSALSLRAALTAFGLLLITLGASPHAQVAGRNVNMVTGGTFPGGDPFLQKQNEPSIAMSTRNPCHLLAGANDYRAVNLPGLPDDLEIGDSWVGWYESTDCGATFYSTLVPGYPQDNSPEGIASPAKGFTTAADPVLKSGAAGTFYYLFIAFNRGSNVGNLSLARFIDHNDREVFIDPDKIPERSAIGVRPQPHPVRRDVADGERQRRTIRRQAEPGGVSRDHRHLHDGRRDCASHERLRGVVGVHRQQSRQSEEQGHVRPLDQLRAFAG